MTGDEIRVVVRNFIIENFLFDDDGSLQDGASFLNEGIIDSTGILELVEFLDEEFSIDIEDDELIPENLDSIDNVVKFVSGKQK